MLRFSESFYGGRVCERYHSKAMNVAGTHPFPNKRFEFQYLNINCLNTCNEYKTTWFRRDHGQSCNFRKWTNRIEVIHACMRSTSYPGSYSAQVVI